jgi:cell division transport system ATP-binding protein
VYENGVTALESVNLHIRKGEFAFLIGPSGAGKTTLMRLIFRDLIPKSGDVIVDGRNIRTLAMSRLPYLRRNIGVVFQDFKLLNNRSVYENVSFALHAMGFTGDLVAKNTNKALDAVGLLHKKNFTPLQLSGGERQRVCIARAIVNDPVILLTDEPTGNLDPYIAHEIMKVIVEINRRGTTVLFATHNNALVDKLKTRVIALKNGKVVKDESKGSYNFA